MKDSGAPESGDLVVARYDVDRGIHCVGIVVECRGLECRVLWGSESNVIGWWKRHQLEVVDDD